MKIKILKVDNIAYAKGFRRGQIHNVIGIEEDAYCNAGRGKLALAVGKRGRTEGFYRDQYRIRAR